jgi:hypothetical protein
MLDSEGWAVMYSGGDLERVAYSRVRRLWAARVAIMWWLSCVCRDVLRKALDDF